MRQRGSIRAFTSSSSLAEAPTATFLPSVQHLLHEHGISSDDASSIPASGPNGRLLKGDVLAYLGQIDKSYPGEVSKRLDKLSHLDLSNIKLAAPKQPEAASAAPAAAFEEPVDTEIAIPISLAAALACQKRINDTLGISLPLTTFIARAIEMANDELPRDKTAAPSADELFNAVLGLDQVARQTSRGHFMPSVVALPPAGLRMTPTKKPDIIDILASKKAVPSVEDTLDTLTGGGAQNVFSVTAGKGEEKRATVFLERMKAILELEPGRLVL